MKKCMFVILFAVVSMIGMAPATPLMAAAKTYTGSGESAAHCSLWSTDRLRWPQTSVGREKQECRRRAVQPTSGVIVNAVYERLISTKKPANACAFTSAGPPAKVI